MDKKCTRHHWCALRKFCKSGEIDVPLPDLNSLLFALVLVVLIRALALVLSLGLWALTGEMSGAPTIEATISITWTGGLWTIWPWAS